jgi:TRAP-type C4-dicarboxylate transport system substrate-binding protein
MSMKMLRRQFLKAAGWLGAGTVAGRAVAQQARPIGIDPGAARVRRIGTVPGPFVVRMAGYGPADTSFSQGLALIGERLVERFGDVVDVRQMPNVMDAGFAGTDLSWLVESGVFTAAYATLREPIAELEAAALPFLFGDTASARGAMDGPLGDAAARRIESVLDVRVLGFFENGFRHVSNSVRPVRVPADLRGLKIRVLPTQIRTFELLGAEPINIGLQRAIEALKTGEIDGQENPFANTVTYGIHTLQRYHTATYHSYLSRPIFVNRATFETWPQELQTEIVSATRDAVALQRRLKDAEEIAAAETIRSVGGEIVELTAAERAQFVAAVEPIYAEARSLYAPEVLALIGR